ncbi:MAG: hypothetical protein JRN52_01500 [Nitrososphaerota archaeon]|nr:hypothetical protein [Nitrososphaerota archaeon]
MMSLGEFIEDLEEKGYSVKYNTKVKGVSGLFHRVDGIAESPKGEKKTIVWLEKRGNAITEIIQTFAVAYDADAEPCYVIEGALGEEERKLAEYYKMKLLTRE